jgi:glycosyltransferase involved in cell wall biosynthesis
MQVNSEPRFTVVMPLYNKARTVEAALLSIVRQTRADWTAIVVNDGSTDASVAVASRVQDPRIHIIHQANAGPGAARNRGLMQATTPWLAFLDADDEWMPHYLEAAAAHADRFPDTAALSTTWIDQPEGRDISPQYLRRGMRSGRQQVTPDLHGAMLSAMLVMMSPCTTVVKTEVARRLGGFHENGARYGEDAHFWLKVLLTEPVDFALEARVNINRGASELSNRRSIRGIEPFLLDPTEVRRVCPPHLTELLARFLCVRANKTACMLAYWGRWREAMTLRRRVAHPGAWREPLGLISQMAATPFGSAAGWLHRRSLGLS